MTPDIRLLGPLEIDGDTGGASLGGPRSERLLAALLLNPNAVVSVGSLIDMMWDVPPSSARQQVHTTVNRLRTRLGPGHGIEIVTAHAGYQCTVDADRIDVTRFRALVTSAVRHRAANDLQHAVALAQEAFELWRGPTLAGLEGQRFANIRLLLDEERLAALELLLDLRVRIGEGAHVVGELTNLVRDHPLREAARSTLMAALHASGRTPDALAVYEQGRQLLAEEFGLDPGQHLRQLQEWILQDAVAAEAAPVRPARSHSVSPQIEAQAAPYSRAEAKPRVWRHFLPHNADDFSGRVAEVEQLLKHSRQTRPSSLVISAINGMGGIGKTALAVRFAHAIADDYFDGQYFVDLRGFTADRDPLTPLEALEILLQQCGTPAELIPPDLDARSAAWRAEMSGKKALILLDNAIDVQQLRPLLPGGSGPLIVITSRRRLVTLEGASSVSLDPMTIDDACALFTRIAGADRVGLDHHGDQDAERETIRTVVELCGRLPLAIRIAAARFRDRASWTLDYLARLLQTPEQRLPLLESDEAGVAAVLALSHRYLSPEQGRLFRLLSVHPGQDFDARTAAIVADITEERALTILEALYDDNLILQDKPGRYSFHDLVHDCATQLCREFESAAESQRAHDRLVDDFLQNAVTWCEPIARGPFRHVLSGEHPSSTATGKMSPAESHRLLAERGTDLIEVARSALKRSSPRRAWQMVCAVQPLLRDRNYAGDALELFEQAAGAARAAGDAAGESLCLLGVALVLRERFAIDDACRTLEKALALSRDNGDRYSLMYQLNELAIAHVQGERYASARRYFEEAQPIAREVGDERLAATLSANLGVVCEALGLVTEGLEHLAVAVERHRALDAPLAVARDTLNIGALLLRDGRLTEAVEQLTEAARLERLHKGDDGYVSASAHAALAVAERLQGHAREALSTGRTALSYARDKRVLDVECEALNALGEAHLATGNLPDAELCFKHAAELSRKRRLHTMEARAHEGFAHVALRHGRHTQARRHFEDAIKAYPPDAADVRNSKAHLADLESAEVRCTRCSGTPALS